MKNNKKVFVYGSFNVLHNGHLRLLKFAKDIGGELIVGLIPKRSKNSQIQTEDNVRVDSLNLIGWIDKVMVISDLKKAILDIKPDFIVKGKEFEHRHNFEEEIIGAYGGRLLFSSGNSYIDFHNSNSKKNFSIDLNRNSEFINRHKIDMNKIIKYVKNFKQKNICVIGDVIIDEYVSCSPLGMSQEDPLVVFTPVDSNKYIGGASIVAAHCAKLGANVDIFSIIGRDNQKNFLKKKLKEYGVKTQFTEDDLIKNIVKQRFKSSNKTIFKLSHLANQPISQKSIDQLFYNFADHYKKYDAIIFSDFNYGVLNYELVNKIIKLSKNKKIFLSADSQSSSQIGDINKYRGVNLLTPTEREARIGLKNENDGLVEIANQSIETLKIKNIILKLGENGMLIHKKPQKNLIFTDKLNSFAYNSAIDSAGAGDSLLSGATLMMCSGASIWESSFLGNILAAIQVSREGNIPISSQEVLKLIHI